LYKLLLIKEHKAPSLLIFLESAVNISKLLQERKQVRLENHLKSSLIKENQTPKAESDMSKAHTQNRKEQKTILSGNIISNFASLPISMHRTP
jgi:hypothetical protein